jgi:hypothetical protein
MCLGLSCFIEKVTMQPESPPAYLVLDTESVPDGKLLSLIKYAQERLTAEEAVQRAQEEARQRSRDGSDFLSPSFQFPVAVCVIRVGANLLLQRITCLDAPQYRPRMIVRQFWDGLGRFSKASLVTYNGRGFDMPLLELAAFRYGIAPGREYFAATRGRRDPHLDLMAWLNNYGSCHHAGGLNLLAKLLGKPGKMEYRGDQVYAMWLAGKLQEINDYCMYDTLDTYFAFLRTKVLTGEATLEREQEIVANARAFLTAKVAELPALQKYLDNWGDWNPWP